MKIEIGGGLALWPGFTNLDPAHGEGEFRRRAEDGPWPLADCSVEAGRASHVLEHVAARTDRLAVFSEMWRVLVPGGTFEIIVPLFSAANPVGALADPTHRSLWIKESFEYFTGQRQAAATYAMPL